MKALMPLLAAVALSLAQPAFAKKDADRDDDARRGRAPSTKFENDHDKYKYEYKYKSGKAKVDQKGDCSGIAFPRPVVHGREPLPRAIPPEPQARTIECNREVIGAVLGGAIGKSMDDADQACAAQALEYANFKQSVRWQNKAKDAWYMITPVGLVPADGKGQECRRYSMLTEASGRKQATQGTACRQRDGSWRLYS